MLISKDLINSLINVTSKAAIEAFLSYKTMKNLALLGRRIPDH